MFEPFPTQTEAGRNGGSCESVSVQAHVYVCAEAVILRLDRTDRPLTLRTVRLAQCSPLGVSSQSELSHDTQLPGCTVTSNSGGQEAGGQESCTEAHRAEQLVRTPMPYHLPRPS